MEKYFNIKTFKIKSPDEFILKNIKKKWLVIKRVGVVYIDELVEGVKFEPNRLQIYFPYVKSLLQKSIRRQETETALSACKYMMKNNQISQVVRRLLIIMVEDVTVFETEFHILVWLTTQKYFTRYMCCWLLGLTKSLCEYKHCYSLSGCRTKEMDVCIKTRISYGGMKCDMNMLERVQTGIHKLGVTLISFSEINDLKLIINKTYLASMDFHVSNIDQLLHKKFPHLSIKTIKSHIWDFRSSVNTRKNTDKEPPKLSNFLKTVDSVSKFKIQCL